MELINARHGFYYTKDSRNNFNRFKKEFNCFTGELAGYSEHSYPKLVRSLKTEIVSRAENYLAVHSAKAATKIVEMLEEDGTTPHANIRMEAAKQILDRIGIVKKEHIDVNVKALHGIFVLPAKDNLYGTKEDPKKV
jgi:coenzyme F420-reducing hydrogenase delta subunit